MSKLKYFTEQLYVMVPKAIIEDTNLSYSAKGFYAFLSTLSNPDMIRVIRSIEITNIEALQAIKELQENGYIPDLEIGK